MEIIQSVLSFLITLAGLLSAILPVAHADMIGGEPVPAFDPIHQSTVALYEPTANGRSGSLCTASLISKDTAVTAAHCVTPGGRAPVMIFGDDINSAQDQIRPVTGVEVNPKWQQSQGRGMDQGDIAVVKFQGGTPDGYGPARMATSDRGIKKGQATDLAGYGISDAKRKTGAGTLRKTTVAVASPRRGKSEMILDQSHGHGACHGDSGGPAFMRSHGRPVLVGVTNRSYPDSAADDCGHKVVYTKVSAYKPWIKDAQRELHEEGPTLAQDPTVTTQTSRTLSSIKRKIERRTPRFGRERSKHPRLNRAPARLHSKARARASSRTRAGKAGQFTKAVKGKVGKSRRGRA